MGRHYWLNPSFPDYPCLSVVAGYYPAGFGSLISLQATQWVATTGLILSGSGSGLLIH